MRWVGGANRRSLPAEQNQAAQLSKVCHGSHARLSDGEHAFVKKRWRVCMYPGEWMSSTGELRFRGSLGELLTAEPTSQQQAEPSYTTPTS